MWENIPVYDLDVRPPSIASADGGDTVVTLALVTGGGADRENYRLYYSTSSGIDPWDASTYDGYVTSATVDIVLSDLINGTPYYFRATEIADDGQESDAGNEISATPNAAGIEELSLLDVLEVLVATDGGVVELGTVGVDSVIVDAYLLRNTGDETLILDEATFSCTGDAAFTDPFGVALVSLDPGETITFYVQRTTSAAGAQSYAVSFGHDGTDTPFTATFNFDVTADDVELLAFSNSDGATLAYDDGTFSAGTFTEGSVQVVTYRLYNRGNVNITIDYDTLAVSGYGENSGGQVGQLVRAPGDYGEIEITYNTATVGTGQSLIIEIEHNGVDEEVSPFTVTTTHTTRSSSLVSRLIRVLRFSRRAVRV